MCAPQSLTAASTGGDLAFRNKVTAGLIVRWNGTRWQVAPYPATPGDRLTSVAGTSAGHIWAAAWNEYLRHCRILRWDGRVWARHRASRSLLPAHLRDRHPARHMYMYSLLPQDLDRAASL